MATHPTPPKRIEIRGAKVHNLKNLDVDIPLHQVVGIAGVSGSGKSSLALGVVYAEGSRRYLEALSTYTRRRMTQAAQAEVEALEQVIDGLKEQLRSRRIRRMQQGSGTMELGFVWSDVLTDLERAADHCSNIAGCVAGLPDGNQGLHAAQTALRQQDPAFEDRVRRYAEKYRVLKTTPAQAPPAPGFNLSKILFDKR